MAWHQMGEEHLFIPIMTHISDTYMGYYAKKSKHTKA